MYPKPKGFNNVGFIQCFLAAFFVLWFFIMPQNGIYFAWPVKPELTALFMGAGFILRSYFGYHLWRDKYWYTIRWSMNGDFAFLGTLFVTTWWHVSEMNWNLTGAGDGLRIFSLVIAHVWVLAYTFEPLTVFLLHPRDKQADGPVPAEYSEGKIQPLMKNALAAIFLFGAAVWAVLFFSPDFANTRWPWELNPFELAHHVRVVCGEFGLGGHHVLHEGLGRGEDRSPRASFLHFGLARCIVVCFSPL